MAIARAHDDDVAGGRELARLVEVLQTKLSYGYLRRHELSHRV
jgi:hypothetical protein